MTNVKTGPVSLEMFNCAATNLNDKGIINLRRYNKYLYKKSETPLMANAVDERMPEEKCSSNCWPRKANIIKDHLWSRQSKLTIVANIGPTMGTFKLYDLSEEDSLKLHVTLSNLGDIDDQIYQLWLQVNFVLRQYCPHCQH